MPHHRRPSGGWPLNMLLPKSNPLRDPEYLKWLRTQPCVITGAVPCDPAHIGTMGKGIKSPDNEAIPLLHAIHAECHQHGEMTTLRMQMPNSLLRECLRAYAREMHANYLEMMAPEKRDSNGDSDG